MASDQTFFIVRKLGALNSRVPSSLQNEIVELEERLDFMDREYSKPGEPDVNNGSLRDDPFVEPDSRNKLVREILPQKLAKYSM